MKAYEYDRSYEILINDIFVIETTKLGKTKINSVLKQLLRETDKVDIKVPLDMSSYLNVLLSSSH